MWVLICKCTFYMCSNPIENTYVGVSFEIRRHATHYRIIRNPQTCNTLSDQWYRKDNQPQKTMNTLSNGKHVNIYQTGMQHCGNTWYLSEIPSGCACQKFWACCTEPKSPSLTSLSVLNVATLRGRLQHCQPVNGFSRHTALWCLNLSLIWHALHKWVAVLYTLFISSFPACG